MVVCVSGGVVMGFLNRFIERYKDNEANKEPYSAGSLLYIGDDTDCVESGCYYDCVIDEKFPEVYLVKQHTGCTSLSRGDFINLDLGPASEYDGLMTYLNSMLRPEPSHDFVHVVHSADTVDHSYDIITSIIMSLASTNEKLSRALIKRAFRKIREIRWSSQKKRIREQYEYR